MPDCNFAKWHMRRCPHFHKSVPYSPVTMCHWLTSCWPKWTSCQAVLPCLGQWSHIWRNCRRGYHARTAFNIYRIKKTLAINSTQYHQPKTINSISSTNPNQLMNNILYWKYYKVNIWKDTEHSIMTKFFGVGLSLQLVFVIEIKIAMIQNNMIWIKT